MPGNIIQPTRGAVLGALAGLALMLAGLGQASAQETPPAAKGEVIAEVRIVGNNNLRVERILRFIHTRRGDEYNYNKLIDDVTRLINSHLIRNATESEERTAAGVIVTFRIEEYPSIIEEVAFKNVHHITQKDLENLTPNIRRGMPLSPWTNAAACFKIQKHLKQQGRYWAQVSLEEGIMLTEKRVIFNVTEGPKVWVRSTNFVGNDTLASSERLRTQVIANRLVFRTEGLRLHVHFDAAVFNPETVEEDIAKLEDYYRSNGYAHVKVTHELSWSLDKSQVDIVFHIHEGERSRVQGFDIQGVDGSQKNALQSIVQVKGDEVFKEGVITLSGLKVPNQKCERGL